MKFLEIIKNKSLMRLTGVLSVLAVVAILIIVFALYTVSIQQHRTILTNQLDSQARWLNNLRSIDQRLGGNMSNDALIRLAIDQLRQADTHRQHTGIASEFALARREGDQIIHLYSNATLHQPAEQHAIGFNHKRATAMRLALLGESGTRMQRDYRDIYVLAAYRYLPEYQLGMVCKVAIEDIVTPYLVIVLIAGVIAVVFVFVSAFVFIRATAPAYRQIENNAERISRQHSVLTSINDHGEAQPCDMDQIFGDITSAASRALAVSRVGIWLFDDARQQLHCASLYTNEKAVDCEVLCASDYPNYFEALAEHKALSVENVYTDSRTKELAKDYLKPNNITALLGAPIMLDGESIGVICHEQVGEKRKWQMEDLSFAHSMAGHIAMVMNNCRRNKAEQYLKESEKRYELAVAGANDGLWDWDLVSNKVYRSPQYMKLLGYESKDLKQGYDFWLSHLHPDDRQRAEDSINAHLEDANKPYDVEFRLRNNSGEYRWFRGRGSALRDKTGKPYRVSGAITDITDLKEIQDDLNRFKQSLGEISENIFMFDPDTLRFFYVNKSAIDDTGYTEEELMQMTPVDIKPEFTEKTFRQLLSTLETSPGDSLNFETMHLRKNGEQKPVEVHLQYIAPANTSPRFVAIVRDISERKNSEIENYIQRTLLEHIYKVQDEFISGQDRRKVFEQLLNGVLDITESEFGLISEVIYPVDEPPYLRTRHITNIAWNSEMRQLYEEESPTGLEFKQLDNLLGAVITSGETVISNDPVNDPRSGGLPPGHPTLESFMGIPLKLGDRLTGLVGIANRAEGYNTGVIKLLQPLLSTCTNLLEAEKAEALRDSMEIALIDARDEAEQANRTKSEFLSSMSHELRTPLNAIMGFAHLLQLDKGLTGAQQKHAKVIYNAGSLLLELINDVLDHAKIEAGHIDLVIEPVRLCPVLVDSFRLIRPLAEKNNISLSYDTKDVQLDCNQEIWVRADITRLMQVILNLLSNAIKYNKKNGSVNVWCQVTRPGFHQICFTDSGRGISNKDMETLFQPFNRLGAQQGEIEGTGIGLVITRKLVELMGGSISVESEQGKGSTFMIELPVAEAMVEVNSSEASNTRQNNDVLNRQQHILVAEDNITNQELIALQLEVLGFTSDVVTNGAEAIKNLQTHNYDLVLTDIHMPEMDGYQLAQAIRASTNNRIRRIHIVAITANASADEATRCIESGMNDCLSKPVNIDELKAKLDQWLPREAQAADAPSEYKTGHARPAHAEAEAISNQATLLPAINTELLIRYVGPDPDKHRRFFKLFLNTAPETIAFIHQAYEDRNCSGIEDACHKLKSSARAIGADRLSNLCQKVESASKKQNWAQLDKAIPEFDTAMVAVEDYIQAQLTEQETEKAEFNFEDVLIVDDDRFVLDLVTAHLNNLGINNVITASSGEDALSYMKNATAPPSVLLLDLNMPGMDGVEFLRHLSEQAYLGNIILISAEDTRLLRSAENIARDRKLNILGALEKPVTIPPLTDLLLQVGTEQATRPHKDKISITENDLRNGIENGEFMVYYQPQIDITSMQLSGVEALARWSHPQHGMIPPDVFIPVAEEHNLINHMTDVILSDSMAQCSHWREQGLDINLSVNISVDSLDRLDLPEYIVSCAQQHQLDVSKIMLEITESRLMQDITSALDILTRLSLKGIGLSIDDFGTGYSSMEQLQRVPFKELKIDRSFVNGAQHNKAARAILQSSVELAQKLNMTIVAEGIENEAGIELVAELGCTSAQGYFIGRPMPGNEVIRWHQDWKSRY